VVLPDGGVELEVGGSEVRLLSVGPAHTAGDVVVHVPGRGNAIELERRLAAEGLPVRRRWRYVTVGVLTEERADELAARVRDELPDADVRVEVDLSDVSRSALQFLPF